MSGNEYKLSDVAYIMVYVTLRFTFVAKARNDKVGIRAKEIRDMKEIRGMNRKVIMI